MDSPETVMRRLAEAWNTRDSAAVDDLFAPDAEFHDMAFGVTRSGLPDIVGMFQETWQGIPDLHTELTQVISQGDWVASEWTLTGTHTGDFPNLPATGRSLEVQGVSVTRVREGKIVAQRDYYDRAAFLEQLGVSPGGR